MTKVVGLLGLVTIWLVVDVSSQTVARMQHGCWKRKVLMTAFICWWRFESKLLTILVVNIYISVYFKSPKSRCHRHHYHRVDPSYMISNWFHIFDNISWNGHPWSIIDYCIIYYCLSGTRISDNCYIWSQSCCCRRSKSSCWGHFESFGVTWGWTHRSEKYSKVNSFCLFAHDQAK